jgi:chromosome segregation ATPase
VGTLEGVLQEIRNAQAAHHAAMREAHEEHRKHVDQVLSGILSAVETSSIALKLIADRMGNIVNDLDTLAGAFGTFATDVNAKLAELIAAEGTFTPEQQAKVDALQAAIQAADDHLATVGLPPVIAPETGDTAAGGADAGQGAPEDGTPDAG